MVEGIGTIAFEFEDPFIDPNDNSVVIPYTTYMGGKERKNVFRHPLRRMHEIARIEAEEDVQFVGVQDGKWLVFADVDAFDDSNVYHHDPEKTERVVIPESLRPPEGYAALYEHDRQKKR